MLILRREDCQPLAFVLPPRTGSRSIEHALAPLVTSKLGSRHYFPAPKAPSECEVISSVRNPFDILVSWFHFPDSSQPEDRLGLHLLGGDGRTFSEFLDEIFSGKNKYLIHSTMRHASRATEYIRYENGIEDELNRILVPRGYPSVAVPHIGKTSRPDFNSYYTPELKAKVIDKFGSDFEKFGYPV